MKFTAKLLCHGVTIMTRNIAHPNEASDALGGVTGPGYSIVVERSGVSA